MNDNNYMNDKWYNSVFATNISEGIGLMLICIGIGSCSALCFGSIKINKEPEKVEQHDTAIKQQ